LESFKNIECHKSVIVLGSNPGETNQNESETEAGNPFGQRAIAVVISLESHSRCFLRATNLLSRQGGCRGRFRSRHDWNVANTHIFVPMRSTARGDDQIRAALAAFQKSAEQVWARHGTRRKTTAFWITPNPRERRESSRTTLQRSAGTMASSGLEARSHSDSGRSRRWRLLVPAPSQTSRDSRRHCRCTARKSPLIEKMRPGVSQRGSLLAQAFYTAVCFHTPPGANAPLSQLALFEK
jgi:hypothetical protein